MRASKIIYILYFGAIFYYGCHTAPGESGEIEEYTGPIVEIRDAVTYYSDSAVVKMKMTAPLQLEFGNGDREFPEGLKLEFFDENGNPTSTLRADYCYYTKKEDVYKATGNVVIQDVETDDRLDTEELYWNQRKEEVYTDKFVRIEKDGELHVGEGLEAKTDFSYWKILHSKGTISLNEQEK